MTGWIRSDAGRPADAGVRGDDCVARALAHVLTAVDPTRDVTVTYREVLATTLDLAGGLDADGYHLGVPRSRMSGLFHDAGLRPVDARATGATVSRLARLFDAPALLLVGITWQRLRGRQHVRQGHATAIANGNVLDTRDVRRRRVVEAWVPAAATATCDATLDRMRRTRR